MPTRDVYVFVHLGADWVPSGLLRLQVEDGELAASSFRYGQRYLERRDAFPIDVYALPLRDEVFQTEDRFTLFTGISDALPDAWGRAVMERRAGRPLREDEVLMATPDTRVGALAFGASLDGPDRTLPWEASLEAYDRVELAAAMNAYERFQQGEAKDFEEALRRFVLPGSSLGGARPKATVVIDGELWIAKFSRSQDGFDYPRAEWATMQLAARCGIAVPPTSFETVAGRGAFLVKRFDRDGVHRRPLNSMLTVLGESELSFFHSSYMDMAEACRKHVRRHEAAQQALFRRMVFNGLAGNDDDHLRNHALLGSGGGDGFQLSPAYDLVANPAVGPQARLSVGCGVDAAGRIQRLFSTENAVRAAPRFGLSPEDARGILAEVKEALRGWRAVFEATGMAHSDMEVFGRAFERVSSA